MFAPLGSHRFALVRRRSGLSLLEVVGCLVAVVAGLWLGAQYLGLNLHSIAYTTLDETAVLEQLPEPIRPRPPVGLEPVASEELTRQLNDELEAIRHDLFDLQQQNQEQAANGELADDLGTDIGGLAERRQQTLEFWSRLGEIRLEVERIQASAQTAASEENVWKVLEIRQRANQYGAKAVEAAMVDVVDPQALQFAKQLVGWYEQGADLYGEAMKVWQGQHDLEKSVHQDRVLDQARKQHDNEALLLFQKGGRLREVLIRRYQVPFPGLQPEAVAEEAAAEEDQAEGFEPTLAPISEQY